MAGTACKTLGHLLGMSVEELTWNIAKESLTQLLQMDILVGLHYPSCRLTLRDSQIVVGTSELTRHAREEDTQSEWQLLLTLRFQVLPEGNKFILRVLGIEVEQFVGFAEHNACLVENTIAQPYILTLGLRGIVDDLHLVESQMVHLVDGHHETTQQSCRRRQTANRHRAFHDATNAVLQVKILLQRPHCTTQIVAPVVLLLVDGPLHVECHQTLK